MIKKLKSTLMKIATADASEILRTFSTNGEIDKEKKISKKLSVAISSIKIKTTKDAVECEVKTVDKLKAIELCLKLLGADCSEGKSDILVNYDYNENSTDE